MTDYFALLDQPRRPWLDAAQLHDKFIAVSRDAHPDRSHHAAETERNETQRRFADLNTAWRCLSSPKTRILHLLELELGNRPPTVQAVPQRIAELFMRVMQATREVDAFLRAWSAASGLARAQMFTAAQEHLDRLQNLQREISESTATLDKELLMLDSRWEADRVKDSKIAVDQLIELYQLYSYYGRWSVQIQERMHRLAV